MRLKQLLGVLALLLICTVTAAAAESQLTKVSVASQGNATTVTLLASGVFTHNDYRPAENLLLVDLAGVGVGTFTERATPLHAPGVKSYRVVGYTGAGGKQITRFELTLDGAGAVQFAPVAGGLEIHVTGNGSGSALAAKATAPEPVAVSATNAAPKPATQPTTRTVTVKNISVARGQGTLDVEIAASGALTPQASRLSHPDRLVIDMENAVTRPRTIAVNSGGVKAVRMARFKENPPTARLVVDLAGARDYDLTPAGDKVLLKIHTPEPIPAAAVETSTKPVAKFVASQSTVTAPAAQPMAPPVERPAVAAPAQPKTSAPVAAPVAAANQPTAAVAPQNRPEPKPAENVVMVQPKVETKPASPEAAAALMQASVNPPAKTDIGTLPASTNFAQPAVNLAQAQRQQMATPASQQGPRYTGEPISVNLKDVDLRDFFRLVHEISGLNIVLDPNVKGTLTLVLDDVPWDQALDLVLKNNGLDRQLEGNVLRIATVSTITNEAEARRAQAEKLALAVDKVTVTRFLSYAHSKDVASTLKKFLSQRGDVIADERTNALIIQDIPSVIPEIDRLVQQLDRKTQQVEIEARVVAATRNFARDIGTQLGFGWGNGPTAVGGTSSVGPSPIQVGFPGAATGAPQPKFFIIGKDQIPLFTNFGLERPTSGLGFTNFSSNYRLDFLLTMAESRGLLKILSRPRAVTQNNIQAEVRQGLRIPVVTQAQLQGPPTTTYTEAFLRMTVTPQITVENTIFLNIDVENTTPDFSRTVGGNPTLITQQAKTQVLVADGGTVVIGGVIQTQNSVTTQQVPFLGDIPVMGNLFKRRSVSTSTQELIFFIVPKIIQT